MMNQGTHELLEWLLAPASPGSSTDIGRPNDSCPKTSSSVINFTNGGGQLVQVQKELPCTSERQRYSALTAMLSRHALSHALAKSILSSASRKISHFELMFSLDKDGALEQVICLRECYRTPFIDLATARRTFSDWLIRFKPITRQDYMLVLPLYRICSREEIFEISKTSPTPDPWLDSMLRESRGMLLWTHQWAEFLRMGCGFNSLKVAEFLFEINLGRLKACELFRGYVYEPTGQTLEDIFNERSPFPIPIGHQDHLTGDWLWERLAG